jgi:hypothetical protein
MADMFGTGNMAEGTTLRSGLESLKKKKRKQSGQQVAKAFAKDFTDTPRPTRHKKK